MCQTGAKQVFLDEFYIYGKMPDDPCFKCMIKCVAFKLNVMTPEGDVDVKRWSDLFVYLDLPLAQKCSEIVEPDLCQKGYLMVKCVNDELSKQFPP